MSRSLSLACALAFAAPFLMSSSPLHATDRVLPMHFELRTQGPAETCGTNCKLVIGASGAITADTPRNFLVFAQNRDLAGATIVIDSDGGSVLGAIALGREIRNLKLATTVGHIVDLPTEGQDEPRATLSPNGDCESMCAFVLLGGVRRSVPADARVMVHQIWLGDRREDPTAASYSAEDLVLVQRDIGRLAQYAADMGASADLLDLALRIVDYFTNEPGTTRRNLGTHAGRAAHFAHDQRLAGRRDQRAAVGSGRQFGRCHTGPASPADR